MDEGSKSSNINFIKLNIKELSSKIALLISEAHNVNFWKKYPTHYNAKIINFNQTEQTLILKAESFYLDIKSDYLFVNFLLREMSYFLKGKVIDQNKNDNTITLKIHDEIFRAEKRKQERLMTFPVYNVFAYLRYKLPIASNVIPFGRKKDQVDDFLSQIDKMEKSQFVDDEETDDFELLGFRVDNLSSNGMSFFASKNEVDKIKHSIDQNTFELMLSFEGQIFNLKNSRVVYSVDYINKTMPRQHMFRVGIEFEFNQEIQQLIVNRTGESLELEDFQKEFEEFIKDE